MNQIFAYIKSMAPYMAYAVPVVLVSRIFAVGRLDGKLRRTTVWHEAGVWLFLLFMAGLASITIVPRNADGTMARLAGWSGFSRINLIPLRIIADSWKEAAAGDVIYPLINIAGNIVMFMPVGFFISLLWKGASVKRAVFAGFACSLTVELCQLFQVRGTDIDDLWLNTLGAVLGYAVFFLMKRYRPLWIEEFRIDEAEE